MPKAILIEYIQLVHNIKPPAKVVSSPEALKSLMEYATSINKKLEHHIVTTYEYLPGKCIPFNIASIPPGTLFYQEGENEDLFWVTPNDTDKFTQYWNCRLMIWQSFKELNDCIYGDK